MLADYNIFFVLIFDYLRTFYHSNLIFLMFCRHTASLRFGFHKFRIMEIYIHVLNQYTVKPVLSGHLKIDKTKVLMVNGNLMNVVSIAECFLGAFCNIFDLH